MRLPTATLLAAASGRYCVGAFNVCNMEQVQGLFRGAAAARAPIIVQFTRVIRDYAHPRMLEGLLRAAEAIHPDVAYAVHHDHGDTASCLDAVASGNYGSVMIDASHEAFEMNVAITRRVVEAAHARGLAVEAELGRLQGVEDGASVSAIDAMLTDPGEAAAFVARTGCDSLAVAIGTSHGAYKFSGRQRIHLERLREIRERLPSTPLVLHGGSAVPADEVLRINAAGGTLAADASGVSEEEVRAAVKLGVAKLNIGTDGRLIWTRVHREFFRDRPGEFDFMAPGRQYVDAFAAFVESKCRLMGSAGMAAP
jgi:fructose-bisphosphate aldolase class II